MLSYRRETALQGINIWTDHSSVLSQYTRLTDGRTDRRTDLQTDSLLIARPRLHSMQRGKNSDIYAFLEKMKTFYLQ